MPDIITREILENELHSKAIFSVCYNYRYSITKTYKYGEKKLLFILLNPSQATEKVYDPTLLRCKKRAEKSNYKQLRICNLFALRTTNPEKLKKVYDPIGPLNNNILKKSIHWSDVIICSWGNLGILNNRAIEVIQLIRENNTPVFHLGLTKKNQPKHLLYISYDKIPIKWF